MRIVKPALSREAQGILKRVTDKQTFRRMSPQISGVWKSPRMKEQQEELHLTQAKDFISGDELGL